MTDKKDVRLAVAEEMGRFVYDPLAYVMFVYPWGEGELSGFDGPDQWQKDVLNQIGAELKARKFDGVNPVAPLMMATASGHGIGKSALTAWITNWIMDTRPFANGVITANTAPQLETKTWAEIAKWNRRSITRDLYEVSTGKGNMKMVRKGYKDSWKVVAQTCKEENSEAFAGLHAANSTPFYIFDEASAVPDKIWEVAEGGLTDGEPIWLAFGNGTRASGRFRDAFFKGKRWITRQIDSRTAKMTNKALIETWEREYGEDSDFFRVRVKGQFPSVSIRQFFPTDRLDAAKGRKLHHGAYQFAPVVLSCDPAWEGDDDLVISMRQGLFFKILEVIPKNDNDVLIANKIMRYEDEYKADAVFIDGGYGTGIKSAGATAGRTWELVWFAAKSPDNGYLNMRAYMMGQIAQWLKDGGALPDDDGLYREAVSIETVPRMDGKIQLESKQSMKARGLTSPNKLDSLALTFARPVVKKQFHNGTGTGSMATYQTEYDPNKL